MPILVENKRIYVPVSEFRSEESFNKFVANNRITNLGLYLNVTSEWVPLQRRTNPNGDDSLVIPRRYPLQYLTPYIKDDEIVKIKSTKNYEYRNVTNDFDAKNEEQAEIIDFLVGRNKFDYLSKTPRRALFAETGAGKTFSTYKAISIENHFTFINCPDDKAILTWKQEAFKFTNIKEEEIAVLAGRESIAKIIENKDKYKLVLGSSKTFSILFIGDRLDIVSNFFDQMQFSLLVHDEAHLNLYVMFNLEMLVDAKRTYYLTATPGRRIYKEGKVLQNLLPDEKATYISEVKPRYDVRICYYYSNALKDDIKGINKPGGFDYLNYGKKIIFNPNKPYMRNYLETQLLRVIKAALKKSSDENKIAIVAKTKEENNTIINFLLEKGYDDIGLFNSDISNMDERYEQTKKRIIVTTEKSFAGIVNIPRLEAIVLLYPVSSEQHLLQICGRIRREDNKKSLIYIMVDGDHQRCTKSAYRASKILEPHCTSLEKVYLNERRVAKGFIED